MVNKPQQKQRWVKSCVHKCRDDIMFSIPEQLMNSNNELEMYITLFKTDRYVENYYPESTTKTKYQFCPYCGKNLIEIEER